MVENKYRGHELEKHSSVGITKETWEILRKEKKRQEKSMMRLIDDLVIERYGQAR